MTVADPLPAEAISALRRLTGPEGVIVDPDRLIAYEADALTTSRGTPLAVVFPRTIDEIQGVVRALHESGLPFVPRGAGTGLAGGAVAHAAVLVCTAGMTKIVSVDPEAWIAVVEPGVLTADISEAAARLGLRYLPDPASAAACTIGGNIATDSGGPHCLKHGVTSDHVAGLEVVLPDGERVSLTRGEGGGLDLAGLFIGSEGTLGLAGRIELRLTPVAAAVQALLALFDDLRSAGGAVSAVLAEGILPVALELIDRQTIAVVEASAYAAGLPLDTAAALVVECEGEPEEVEADLGAVEEVLRRHGAREVRRARDEAERLAIWQARKKAYGALGRLAPDVLVQDAVVPRTALAGLLPAIEEVARLHDLRLASFFHAGDGNLHPNLLFDARDQEQVARVEAASREIMHLCVEAGGTITGEHGIGRDKIGYMELIFGPGELAAQRRLKAALDPAGLCNADKMLPPVEAEPMPVATSPGAAGHGAEARVPFEPSGAEELALWLRDRPLDAAPIITGRSLSGEPVLAGPAVSLARLDHLVDYRPNDLTITVGAGTRLTSLQEIAAREGQWLPVESSGMLRSAGGLVAAAPPGAFDASFGPVRRQLLACQIVSSQGEVLRWGRPVVKNVAGYGLCRLVCGSRGRLGVLTEVTFRLWPRPAVRRTFGLEHPNGTAAVADELAAAVQPQLDSGVWRWTGEGADVLTVSLVGSAASVEARLRRLREWAGERGATLSEAAPGSDSAFGPDPVPRPLTSATFRVSAGRHYLSTVLLRLREKLGDELVGFEAYPTVGAALVELDRGEAAARRPAPGWLSNEGDATLAVERGSPSEHAVVEARRGVAEVALEGRVERALAGWPRHWLGDYI
jgi:D-lactate dehydrogenase (cytochrome)